MKELSLNFEVSLIFSCLVYQSFQQDNTISSQTFRKRLIEDLFAEYDNRLAPKSGEGGFTNVSVQIFILSIDTISETNMDFSISMYLRQRWKDSRLKYVPLKGMKSLELDSATIAKVWIPDLFIPAEKRAIVHDVTVPNKLMHVYPDGKIQYSLRISATIKCNFDLTKFPLDSQHCFVELESYGYTKDTLRFEWDEPAVSLQDKMTIPQFGLKELTTSQCDKEYYGVGYSCVRFDFHMDRNMGYYITQVFIPSILIVFLSWVSFWLDIDAVPARISLGLLTVLTMTTQSAGARNNLPKVSYLKAIDLWMAVCLGFVFLALVQFAYVNVLSRVEKRRKTTFGSVAMTAAMVAGAKGKSFSMPDNQNIPNSDTANTNAVDVRQTEELQSKERQNANILKAAKLLKKGQPTSQEDTEKGNLPEKEEYKTEKEKPKIVNVLKNFSPKNFMKADREKARNVDRISRVLFPLTFLVFNIAYWFCYIFWTPKLD